MLSNHLLESALEDLKNISGADFYICDTLGRNIISTSEKLPVSSAEIKTFMDSNASNQEKSNYGLFRFKIGENEDYALLVESSGKDGYMLGRIAVSEIMHLYCINFGKLDVNDFYRSLILGTMVSADIYDKAAKLRVSARHKRVVYCIEIDSELVEASLEILSNIYCETKDDNVTRIGDDVVVLVKSLEESTDDSEEAAREVAYQIVSMINTELMIPTRVTYGKIKNDIALINEAYKEALIALEVAKIFFEEKDVASYSSLGIGRIIRELPRSLCESFLEEVFGESGNTNLSDEELQIIDSFFANNLSIAETSRELFMHRSTLVYKLDRIKKKTGLDIRVFEDALTLKIAIMVAKYISRSGI